MQKGDIGVVKTDSGWIPRGTKIRIIHAFSVCDECLVESIETGYTAVIKNEDINIEYRSDEVSDNKCAVIGDTETIKHKYTLILSIVGVCEEALINQDCTVIDTYVAKSLAYDGIKRIIGGTNNG